jgi:hypothetical protein
MNRSGSYQSIDPNLLEPTPALIDPRYLTLQHAQQHQGFQNFHQTIQIIYLLIFYQLHRQLFVMVDYHFVLNLQFLLKHPPGDRKSQYEHPGLPFFVLLPYPYPSHPR